MDEKQSNTDSWIKEYVEGVYSEFKAIVNERKVLWKEHPGLMNQDQELISMAHLLPIWA